jgi:CelD/BcsL family acetyltransferase involved in cellulose biosynthesis
VVVVLAALIPVRRREGPFRADALRLHEVGVPDRDIISIEYNGLLVARDWVGRAEAAALDFLLDGRMVAGRRRDELHLKSVTAAYEAFIPSRAKLHSVPSRKPSWYVDLDAVRASGRGYLDRLSANTRQQIRRARRLYEQRGALSITRARDVGEALDMLDGLAALHQPYWIGRGYPGAFSYAFFIRFNRRLITAALPRGNVELCRIDCGTQPIGFLYNLVFRGHVYSYQSGFLYEADPRLKPGLVSHQSCIEMHLSEGARRYDFMAGDARYKSNLGQPGPEMIYLLLQRRTARLTLEHKLRAARKWLKRLVSGGDGQPMPE